MRLLVTRRCRLHRTRPTNVYGHSKLMIEHALRWLHALRGLRYASLRYFNAAGGIGDWERITRSWRTSSRGCSRWPPDVATQSIIDIHDIVTSAWRWHQHRSFRT